MYSLFQIAFKSILSSDQLNCVVESVKSCSSGLESLRTQNLSLDDLFSFFDSYYYIFCSNTIIFSVRINKLFTFNTDIIKSFICLET